MNVKAIACGLGLVLVMGVGCVSKVSGGRTAGVPFVKDTMEGRYERPLDVVFEAAKSVIIARGTLNNESIVHNSETNEVKTLVGKIYQRTVYVRVEPVDPKVTAVRVQARTAAGGTDLELAHQVEKEIALKLVQ